jgi:hypothetical protein
MKYIITEKQYRLITEQGEGEGGIWGTHGDEIWDKPLVQVTDSDIHTIATIAGIAALFIPVVGPALSLGIGMADAALYYKRGDKKTAAMLAMFPFLPLGKIVKLVPAVGRLGEKGLEQLAKKLGQEGQALTQLEKEAVEGMAKNKGVLQQDLKSISDDLAKKSQSVSGKVVPAFEKRFSLGECFANNNCPAMRAIISDFYSKLANTAKLTKFFPSEVKVLSRGTVSGREVIETQLKDGTKVLFYKSSGANVATTGKQAGEWFVIPGFAQNGWFFKTNETINLTKGANKYLTDMAEFLQLNGSNMLGK